MGALEELNRHTHWFKKPKQVSAVTKVQYIVKYILNPCSAPVSYYVETALPATGLALMEYFDFGVMDVWRGFYRPKAVKRGGHGARRRRKRGKSRGLPDIGDEIGHALRPDSFHTRQVSDGVRHMWFIYGNLERLLWYWMVADIALDFAYNWASALNEGVYCQLRDSEWAVGSRDEDGNLLPQRYESPFGFQTYESNPPNPTAHLWALGCGFNETGTLSWACSSEPANPTAPPPQGFRTVILRSGPGVNEVAAESHGTFKDGKRDHALSATCGPNQTLVCADWRDGGGPVKMSGLIMSWEKHPIDSSTA